MLIGGILDLSTIDFPGKLCSVIFLSGCPFRCPFCHNHELLAGGTKTDVSGLIGKISENYLIDGVCITGGEPLMQNIEDLCKKLKDAGFAVKIDTNGYYTEELGKILDYVDYVAIDLKTTFEKYDSLVKCKGAAERVRKSVELLASSGIEFEARTTVVPTLVEEREILEIAKFLGSIGVKKYVLQQFRNENTLDERLKNVKPFSRERMIVIAESVKDFVGGVRVRCENGEVEV
ncbi:anaerobic ribonucleoside-triphosphate reductase activating protein [Archaeoglobus veneficus]|uniref:Anaerobic ribonucleoside-triphosphate reductase activating protein n=1 Tax=Archaeoglobus veneficus (strain DSM 11195 / SNP6) TaxID=693661 RepID=F2KP51_ARCVS|nr:anaerobic ribonucleoside-triphosphate reductase activating protein [Archaeoglobus veneficus]AEA46359.1 anaerobic ribonucleoside-triphosphate reductase activating protein [Archaeoglobus veneficus SNP6]